MHYCIRISSDHDCDSSRIKYLIEVRTWCDNILSLCAVDGGENDEINPDPAMQCNVMYNYARVEVKILRWDKGIYSQKMINRYQEFCFIGASNKYH